MTYADTSFLVSIYIQDQHSSAADKLFASGQLICVTPLHRAEFAHAVTQQVFRRHMSATDAERIVEEMEKDCRERIWQDVDFPANAFAVCADLARRHGAKLGVRTLDSLHVACALELQAERFWTFDERQAKLAKAEGLKTS
jgi:predicted nucleic acid-binding protein